MTFTFSITAVGLCIAWMLFTAVVTLGKALVEASKSTADAGLASFLYAIAGILIGSIAVVAAGWLP